MSRVGAGGAGGGAAVGLVELNKPVSVAHWAFKATVRVLNEPCCLDSCQYFALW